MPSPAALVLLIIATVLVLAATARPVVLLNPPAIPSERLERNTARLLVAVALAITFAAGRFA